MPTRPGSVVVDAAEPGRLGRFWADALGWAVTEEDPGGVRVAVPDAPVWGDGGPPALVFVAVPEPKVGKNRVHLDLATPSVKARRAIVDRLEDLGASRVDIGQEETPWVVMADPEGNELCVLDPREAYRDVGPVAAVVLDCADPVELVANFWMRAASWPVLRYTEQFAALRHPRIPTTWLELLAAPDPKAAKNRLHLDVAPRPGDDLGHEVERLEHVGGRRIDLGQGDVSWGGHGRPAGQRVLRAVSPMSCLTTWKRAAAGGLERSARSGRTREGRRRRTSHSTRVDVPSAVPTPLSRWS